MKNIISWTQTYGDERMLNMQLLEYDVVGNYLRNKLRIINIYNSGQKLNHRLYNISLGKKFTGRNKVL